MNNRIGHALRAPPLRLAAVLSLAAAFVIGTIAVPAHADDHGRGKGHGAQRGSEGQQFADRDHREGGHRHYEQRGGRDYYYSAPPVVYAPPGYYQQPGATLYYSFPLYR